MLVSNTVGEVWDKVSAVDYSHLWDVWTVALCGHTVFLSAGSRIYSVCLFSRFVFHSGKDTEATRRNFSIPVPVINQCRGLQGSVNIEQKCCKGKCEHDTTAAAHRELQSIMFPTYFTTWCVKDNKMHELKIHVYENDMMIFCSSGIQPHSTHCSSQ